MRMSGQIRKNAVVITLLFGLQACTHISPTAAGKQNVDAKFSSIQEKIINPRCAVPGCHVGSFPSASLNLEPSVAFEKTVNVNSVEVPTMLLIKPGDAANSYLYRKIIAAPGIAGRPMPLDEKGLTPAQIESIEKWINEGAQDN